MFVGLKMLKKFATITPDTLMLEADRLMSENNLWMLMVVDENRFVGAVLKEDVRSTLPSPATTLSRHELNYLLNKMTVQKIIKKDIPTVLPEAEIEVAAKIMHDHNLAGLPVLDARDRLVGYINRNIMLDVLVEEMGLEQGGVRIAFEIEDRKGVIAEVSGLIFNMGISIISTATFFHKQSRMVVFRVQTDDQGPIVKELVSLGYKVVGPEDFRLEWSS
ncbi:CBS domain-containing protein [Desulfonatronovibrio hydrogenovorans]|uniref:CBS domain-containing protein n=1 Tax=Desulfonatronovibrio hydrogenovorans TaxID=53245 RepID=UPI000490A489|nr:CBS domain-containing protein [Desulfonatronovibrio hydrogenovorans]